MYPLGLLAFSPPAWGWSELEMLGITVHVVFPTRVGMVRTFRVHWSYADCFPHPRGDGPMSHLERIKSLAFSPPAWGWSAMETLGVDDLTVFPTRVGMVRSRNQHQLTTCCFPHPRGDGPFWWFHFCSC